MELDLEHIPDGSLENKWVAIAPDYSHVIAVADRLADLMRQAHRSECDFPSGAAAKA